MKKNIFIVRSPLQVINAIEAKEHFKLDNTLLVLMFNPNDINTKQMKEAAQLSQWDETLIYEKSSEKSSLLSQIKLIKRLAKEQYDFLFSGDFGTINQILIANLRAEHIYLIDDGTRTITVHDMLSKKKKLSFSKRVKLLRYRLFGLKESIKQTINFFTCYGIKPIGDESIVQNEYRFVQTKYLSNAVHDSKIYLLGQNLTEVKCMDDATYISYIKKIIAYYKEEIIYIPHRSEIISDDLKSLFNENFKLQENQGPIELVLLMQKVYPSRIVSFISSALFTLNKIYPETKIDAVWIHEEDLVSYRDVIKNCYTFFDNTTINIVDLNEKVNPS